MYVLGRHVGWKVLYLVHSKRTVPKYEAILGINVREEFADAGPEAERSLGYRAAQVLSNFWKVVSGETKLDIERDQRRITCCRRWAGGRPPQWCGATRTWHRHSSRLTPRPSRLKSSTHSRHKATKKPPAHDAGGFANAGGSCVTRTRDQRIKSPLLYRLS